MENDIEKTNTVFDDDDLDTAIANADDTGMVAQRQVVVESEEAIPDESVDSGSDLH